MQEENERNNPVQKEKGQILGEISDETEFDVHEEYTAEERRILEEGDARMFSDCYLYGKAESYESYERSKTSLKPIRGRGRCPCLGQTLEGCRCGHFCKAAFHQDSSDPLGKMAGCPLLPNGESDLAPLPGHEGNREMVKKSSLGRRWSVPGH